jgi:hypothetical protein
VEGIYDWALTVMQALHSGGKRGLECNLTAIYICYGEYKGFIYFQFDYENDKGKFKTFKVVKLIDDGVGVLLNGKWLGDCRRENLNEFFNNHYKEFRRKLPWT